ncbi:MYND-type zinc finger-containing chromatin reader ZMYND8-like isoform X2 [Ylistrum balloti]|uniref:MYND-type zinc finger-containing chromatin reader ZMYND8-like isoform X2 n=1 Tax=Ylistrum balloti TaxID=509963 RepID=UPI002905B541|nr:MYND-type zinc finger-containing chromatin reader ZMYND8-like isoform X2 [Ylistrum balloti]
MSQGRGENSRDTISLRRRRELQRILPKKEAEKPKDVEKPKEKEKDGEKEKEKDGEKEKDKVEQIQESPPAAGSRGIRTRLSTGSIHMNGTYTVAVAKEIENNQNLMHKDPNLDQAVSGRSHDSWTAEEKLKIVDFAEKFGNRAAGRRFNVGESNVRNWRRLEDDLAAMPASKRANREVPTTPPSSSPTTSSSGRKRGHTGVVEGIHSQGPGGQTVPPKRRKIGRNDGSGEDNRNDYFCWLCHKEGTVICCELCPRVYHTKCLNLGLKLPKDWVCPECEKIMRAECIDTRSKAMSMISIDTLCTLLKYALERMTHQGSDPFMKPVDLNAVPYYTDYIYNAMDLGQLERNIKKKLYGCTEAFLADAKWILHNCIIFNGTHHKLTSSAKMIIKICKHEMNEIELCPDCYWNSCVRKNEEWFSETCRTPHTLVWAKLKGYPFWPAKALREEDDQVDVRFFGAHDRSWVPTSQVYMLSKDIPTPAKNKRGGFENAMEELEIHIRKIREKFGNFEYASFRMPYDKNHVYFHNKMKQPFRKGRQATNNSKFSPKPKSYTVKHVYTNKNPSESPTKAERQSAMLKTADAVRSKYNTMITTRRITAEATQSGTETVVATSSSPKKTDLGIGQTNRIQVLPSKVSPKQVGQAMVIPTNLIKVVKLPSSTANTIIVKQGDIERKVIIKQPENQSKVSIVDKVQDKIKQMNADRLDVEGEEGSASQPKTEDTNNQSSRDISAISDKKMKSDNTESVRDPLISEDISDEISNANVTSDHSDKMDTDDSVIESDHNQDSSMSPSKQIYLTNLQKTIQSCKEKLGLSDDSVLSADEVDDDDDDDEDEDLHDQKEECEKNDSCDANKNNSISMETDISSDKCVTVSSADNSTEIKSDEDSGSNVIDSASTDQPETVNTTEAEKMETESESVVKQIQTDEDEGRTQPPTDQKRDQTSVSKDNEKNRQTVESRSTPQKENSDDSVESEGVQNSECSSDLVQESDDHMNKDIIEEKKNNNTDESASPQKNSVLESTSKPKGSDSKDTSVAKLSTSLMEVDNQSNLVTEVESDSDTDHLVMDLCDGEDLSVTTSKSETPAKHSVSPPVVKSSTGASDKFKQIDLTGVNKVVIVKQSPSSGANTSKSPSSSVAKPLTSKSPISRKSPAVFGKRVPSAEFFQNAVEKTMGSPNSRMDKPKETQQESIEDLSSNPDSDVPAHSEIISKFTKKLMGSIQGTFEMMCSEFISQELQPKNVTKDLQAEIQKMRWEQHQQILELKHNFQLTMAEMKTCWEAEKQRIVSEINSMNSKDKEKAINETKKKQWCASCGKEAIFYCCWNTSYCDYPCQQAHWPKHMPTCMQTQQAQAAANEKEAADKDNQSTAPASSVKASAQDQERTVDISVSSSKSVTGNLVATATVKQTTPVLGSGESPIDVEMERPRPQQWDQPSVQPIRQDCSPYIHAPPSSAVQVPQAGLQFTSIVPTPGTASPINQEQMKKKQTCHGWSEQSMAEAYNAVMTGGMSVNKAAKVFQVPRIRLADRIAALGKAAQLPPGSNGQPIPQGNCNPQMMSGNIVTSQPILQYVQSPQPIISLPPSSLPVQQFTPQMGMQTVQVQGQPTPTGLVQNQQAIVQNRSLVQPNSSVLFPMNVAGGVMPGNLVFSQSGPRPYQLPRPYLGL